MLLTPMMGVIKSNDIIQLENERAEDNSNESGSNNDKLA